ncbi:Uncharacterised protein [uncultured archaeon]|nr:Uncharacterised protein [uncultured archaeon]
MERNEHTTEMNIRQLIQKYGKPYSEELGIDIKSCRSEEISKWFLASILFAARISENIAKKTYREFENRGITTAEKISGTDWRDLVAILDTGGYARYDFKTADKLLEVFGNIWKHYNGDLNKLYQEAKDSRDLEKKLKLGKGIGDVTIAIFLRDMRYCWEKADSKPTSLVREAMKNFGIKNLNYFAYKNSIDIVQLETALLRFSKNLRKRQART